MELVDAVATPSPTGTDAARERWRGTARRDYESQGELSAIEHSNHIAGHWNVDRRPHQRGRTDNDISRLRGCPCHTQGRSRLRLAERPGPGAREVECGWRRRGARGRRGRCRGGRGRCCPVRVTAGGKTDQPCTQPAASKPHLCRGHGIWNGSYRCEVAKAGHCVGPRPGTDNRQKTRTDDRQFLAPTIVSASHRPAMPPCTDQRKFRKVARPAGLEPATSWFVARRSIQLS